MPRATAVVRRSRSTVATIASGFARTTAEAARAGDASGKIDRDPREDYSLSYRS